MRSVDRRGSVGHGWTGMPGGMGDGGRGGLRAGGTVRGGRSVTDDVGARRRGTRATVVSRACSIDGTTQICVGRGGNSRAPRTMIGRRWGRDCISRHTLALTFVDTEGGALLADVERHLDEREAVKRAGGRDGSSKGNRHQQQRRRRRSPLGHFHLLFSVLIFPETEKEKEKRERVLLVASPSSGRCTTTDGCVSRAYLTRLSDSLSPPRQAFRRPARGKYERVSGFESLKRMKTYHLLYIWHEHVRVQNVLNRATGLHITPYRT